eukprot:TRINITY_DN4628_c0_g1_i4.p1 TRINITY_DN4628_c0_g1~~TRINITY_DN4628_c0_g1_i4.p1  ORF type:complete len:3892 (+),score=1173.80 TRINITY_DN4628_c0_g1_i4:73-11676(+)
MAPAAGASPAPRPLRARSRPRARLKAAALFGAAALACSRLPRAAAQALLSLEPTEIGLGGGVPLTVHGQGFSGDQFMGANRVFVGGVECFADDAFTRENRLVCPRAPPSSAAALSAQPLGSQAKYSDSTGTVEVNADGRWVRAGQLALQYKADSTPFLEGIEHAAVDGARIAFRGRLISRLPAEYRVEFGSEERFGEFRVRCSVLDELHDQEIKDVAHEPNDQRAWHCQAKEQPAGFYNASVSIEPDLMTNEQGVGDSGSEVAPSQVGTALPAQPDIFDLFKMTPAGEPYVMAVHALVRSMSANVGSPAGGSVLVLSGSGFSPAGENATVVEVGGAPCHIVSADTAEIVCKVPPQGAVKQRRAEDMQTCASCAQAGCCVPGGAGALVSTWNDVREAPAGSGFRDQPKVGPVALGTPGERIRPGVLRRDRESREADEQAVWHKDMTHWDVLQHGSHFVHNSERYNGDSEVPEALKLRNTGKVYSGYFVPPHAGPYTFYISGNDFAEVWLARNGQMEMICDAIMSEPSRPGRYFNDKDSKPISDPITLTKGSPVYIEVLHADHTGDNFFHLGVSHPPPTGGGAPPYSTVPTMATLLVMSGTESFFINEKRVRLAANCNHDPAAEVESALGRDSGAHVVGSKRSFDSGGCRYFFAVYRPQGTLKIEGDAVKVLLQGSLDWYYEPLPMYMMQLPARRSFAVSVGLSVNGLPAAFAGTEGMTWSYQTQFRVGLGTGTLSPAVVRSGGVLSIDVTPATQLTAAEARVTVGGKPCANDGSSGKAPLRLRSSGGQRFLDCDLPNLEAGAQEVGINLGRYGTPTNTPGGGWQVQYHLTVAGFRQVDLGGDAVPRVVASAEGSLYGGAKVTIVGGGFHVSSPDSNSVQFGGRLCPIVSATATELVCVAPASAGAAAGTVQVRVTVAGCSQCGLGGTLSYTYSTARTPQLSGVTVGGSSGSAPSSGGATVVVTGTRFPTARSTLQVVFCKAGQIVGCTGCAVADSGAAPSATQVECSSPVLEDGAYEVRVLDTKLGWSNPGSRLQTAFRVSEIAPQRCSTEGGAILTISGQGFTKDNFVMLGPVSEVGLECAHRNTTSTQIICQVERNTKQYRGYLRVRVYANKEQSYEDLLHASCDATQRRQAQALQGNGSGTPPAQSPFSDVCQVNFDSGVTAAVTRRNGNGHNSRYTITGTGLGDTVEVRAGGARCDPDTLTVSGTQVTCTMGTGPAGTYRLEVTSRAGFAKLPASERNQWVDFPVVVSEVLPPQGSRGGGMEMVINGFGFHPGATSAAIGDVPCKLLANVTGERIVCLSGLQPTSGSRTVNVTANGISGARNNGWTSSTDDTADVRTVEPNELTPAQAADVVLTVSGMRFPSGNFSVQVGGRDCAVESSTTRKLECRVRNLPALSARPLLITDTGFSVSTREQAVLTAPLSWGAPDGLPLRSGQAGGRRIRLAGEGISDRMHENRVSVCGFPCEVVSSKVGELECLTPRLFTRVSANLFGGTPQAIKFMPHPENRHAAPKMAPMLDGDGETSGLMDRSQSLVIRVEGSSLADIREVWFWPSEDPQAGRKDLLHAVFEARSNPAGYDDGGGWRLLHNVTQIPPTGWSKIVLGDDALKIPPASEVRMRPVEGERIGLTELRIIGFETASGVRTASDGNALCNVAVNVTVQPPWPQPAGDPVIVTKDGAVRYEIALTPIVHAFAPEYGTAAGGTLISIFGERLAATGGGTPEVKVDDVPCTGVRTRACTAAESQGMPAGAADCSVVMCTTGARPQLPDESKVGVTVSIPGKGWAHIAVDPFMYADLWSSALTWRGQQLPAHGDIVLLPKGRNIIVDRSPLPPGEKLMFMLVDGALIFSDEWTQGADETDKEIRLDLNYMLIRGGTLKIGSKNKPYSRGATITLHGDKYRDVPLPVYGIKNIAVRGGTVQLFGQPKVPTWTRLGATAVRGATSIRLRERTNWAVGDQIVIAPGSYSNLESEVRNITAVDRSRGYDVLFFSDALRYEHFGTTELHQGHVIDMSVEVGCLSRSIRIQGDPDSWKQKFGAHMIFHSPNRPLVANLEYVELRRVGQAKQVGRYPIHFHIEKDRPEDVYVKGCAIHNSFNRAIVLHDTNHLDIRENVAFNALGHMFFVEDGAERYNTFTRNLGILALPTGGQLSHDVFTSVFWGANPLNNFIGNAAAGSSHMGFWISPPKHPRQSSYDPTKCPNQVPLGLIQGNTAHSNGRHGFWVHPKHFAREQECGPVPESENPYAVSTVKDLRTWKNKEQGMGLVDVGPYVVDGVVSIDCSDAGLEVGLIAGEQGVLVKNSVFVAHSRTNRPAEWRQLRGVTGYRGLIIPQSEGFRGENLTFIGFKDGITNDLKRTSEHAGVYTCCRCWNDCSSEMGSFTYRFKDVKWLDCPNRVNFGWPHKDMIVDEDGTFTGTAQRPSAPGSTILPAMDHVKLPGCAFGPVPHYAPGNAYKTFTGRRNVAGMICPPKYAFHRVVVYKPTPENFLFYNFTFASPFGLTELLYDEAAETRTWTHGWAAPVATAWDVQDNYPFRLFHNSFLDFRELHLWATELPWNPFRHPLQLDLNYSKNYVLFDVVARRMTGMHNYAYKSAGTPPDVLLLRFQNTSDKAAPVAARNGGISGPLFTPFGNTSTSNMDNSRKILSLLLHNETEVMSFPGRSQLVEITPIQCPRVNGSETCIRMQTEVKPPVVYDWDDPEAWDEGEVPGDGASVTIRKGKTILLRGGRTAKLAMLVIQGELHLLSGSYWSATAKERRARGEQVIGAALEASYIFIHSGKLTVGNETHPFDDDLEAHIILNGGFGQAELSVSNKHFLGSAVIANFGTLQMHGRPVRSWTKLGATAEVGATTVQLVDSVAGGDSPVNSSIVYKAWRRGDTILLPSTGYDTDEAETAEIASVSADGRTLTLRTPLKHRHLGLSDGGLELRGEVALLSRNIKITAPDETWQRGVGEGTYGVHVTFSKLSNDPQFAGQGYLDFVEFRSTGQFGGDRGAFFLDRLDRAHVRLSHVSMWNNQVYAIKTDRLEGTAQLTVSDSVLYWSRQSTVQLHDSRDAVLFERTIAARTELEGPGVPPEISCTFYSDKPNRFHHCIAAGAWQNGFCIYGEPCSDASADDHVSRSIVRPEAHSNAHGFWLAQGYWCTEVKGYHGWRNSYIGFFAMIDRRARLTEATLHDNHIGVDMLGTGGRSSTDVEIRNSIIAGRSPSQAGLPCSQFQCSYFHKDVWRGRLEDECKLRSDAKSFKQMSVGMLLTQNRNGKKPYELRRTTQQPLPYDKLGKVAKYGETRVIDTVFRNFRASACGGQDAAVKTMDESRAHIVPHFFSGVTWEQVDQGAKFYFDKTSPHWRTGVQCGDGWDCSGLQQVLLMSTDGSLHGTGGLEATLPNFDGIAVQGKCTKVAAWNGQRCVDTQYGELFMESLDWDSEDRRIYPLRIEKTDAPIGAVDRSLNRATTYLVNQPPDKYKETEWPSFKRPSYFWGTLELNKHYRIDFGDLPPKRTRWELMHCTDRTAKVLLHIFYPEPLRLQVWLDPDNNETGRTPASEVPVTLDDQNSENYFFGNATNGQSPRLMQVVVQCRRGFEIHQMLQVRVAMRLDMTVEEFYDETGTEEFGRNIARLLGIPTSRIRIVDVQPGSTMVNFELISEDSQQFDSLAQKRQLDEMAWRLGNLTLEELNQGLNVPVSELPAVRLPTWGTCRSESETGNDTYESVVTSVADQDPELCSEALYRQQGEDSDDGEIPWWVWLLVAIGAVVVIGVIAAAVLIFAPKGSKVADEPSPAGEKEVQQKEAAPPADPEGPGDASDFPDFSPPVAGSASPSGPVGPGRVARKSEAGDGPKLRTMRISLHGDGTGPAAGGGQGARKSQSGQSDAEKPPWKP